MEQVGDAIYSAHWRTALGAKLFVNFINDLFDMLKLIKLGAMSMSLSVAGIESSNVG